MLSALSIGGLAVAGIINLLPVSGALGASWLKSLYGFDIGSPDLEILLRHRAILFGIVGALLLASIPLAGLRPAAILVGVASMASFIAIAFLVGNYQPPITRIVIADVIGLVALAPAGWLALSQTLGMER